MADQTQEPGVRMRAQLAQAARRHGLVMDGPVERGVADRTMGGRVAGHDTARWLRVISMPVEQANGVVWDGPVTASQITGIKQPELLAVDTWVEEGQRLRAELWELVPEPICSTHVVSGG